MIIKGENVVVTSLAWSLRLGGRVGGSCLFVYPYSVCIYPVLINRSFLAFPVLFFGI